MQNYLNVVKDLNDIVEIIPPDYRYPSAVESFYKYLNNNRANDMKEAVNLYEEEMHRLRMENIQLSIMEENQKQTYLQTQNALMNFMELLDRS